ncbi:MAG: hypothetical protein KC493_05400 [Bacteriovoracaceae bacterium]|nr:hypothetical protein [Bacteriovoracaceae bacterium]
METKTGSKKLGLLVYEADNAPRYYEIKKGLLKFVLYGLPVISIFLLVLVLSGSVYFNQISEMAKRKEPAIIKELRDNSLTLEKKLTETSQLVSTLQNKLSAGHVSGEKLDSTMGLFLPTPGMQDKTKFPNLALEGIEALMSGDKIQLKFNIINQTKDNMKLAGYIFVLMKNSGRISFFPEASLEENEFKIKFNSGESFATQRFRPVDNVFFPYIKGNSKDYLFKILIFSRTGDLLYKQLVTKQIEK